MQTQGGAPAAAAIEATGRTRYFRWSLVVDWSRNGLFNHAMSDLTGLASDVSLDRQLRGSAPSETMLVEGQAAAELTINLEGEHDGLPVTAVFSEYNGFSPLYTVSMEGCEIVYKIGVDTSVGTIWYPQFTGNVRTISPNRKEGVVTITALDRSEKMRQPVRLPVWAITRWHSIRGYNKAQLCSSHWVIDQCLRTADASVTPFRPITEAEAKAELPDGLWGLQFWLSGNSSYIPNVGVLDNARVQGFPKTEVGGAAMYTRLGEAHPAVKAEVEASLKRPYNLSATTTDATGVVPALQASDGTDRLKSFYLAYRGARPDQVLISSGNAGGSHLFGFTLITRGDGNYYQTADSVIMEIYMGHLYKAHIRIQAGKVRGELYKWDTNTLISNTEWINIPTGRDSVQIDAQFTNPFGTRYMGVRAAETFSNFVSFGDYTGAFDYDTRTSLVILRHQVGLQDAYWVNRNSAFGDWISDTRMTGFARKPAKYAAVLDEGLNKLTLMPSSIYDDAWELAGAIADAEMGAAFWDESGVFRFWNRDTIVAKQDTTVRTFTLDHVDDLGLDSSLDSIRNIVTADALLATSDETVIFDSTNNEEFYIPPTSGVTRIVPSSDDVMAVQPGFMPRFATSGAFNGVWSDAVTYGYIVQWYSGGVWAEDNGKSSGVDVLAYSDGQGNTTLRFWNGYAEPARFSDNAGNARLRVLGTSVQRSDNSVTSWQDAASIAKFGNRNLPLSGDWIQDQPTSISQLGQYVLGRVTASIPTTDGIPVPGDPRLQLGDCVEVQDPQGLGESMRLQILGYRRTMSKKDGLTDLLTVELIRPALLGIWDSEQYGRWDESFIWGP
jgi:hypothetical protein